MFGFKHQTCRSTQFNISFGKYFLASSDVIKYNYILLFILYSLTHLPRTIIFILNRCSNFSFLNDEISGA